MHEPPSARVDATAAAGTASTLAGIETKGTPSVASSSTGATATWAPTEVATSIANDGGSLTRRRATSGATTSNPAVAETDSNRPSDRARNGSTRMRSSVAPASAWIGSERNPRACADSTRPAITDARNTLGSSRVSKANQASTPKSSRRRAGPRIPSARASTSAPASTIATLEPLTAVRWDSPVASIASWLASGSIETSPVTRPTASPAVSSPSADDASHRTRPRTHSVVASAQPGPLRTSTATGSMRTATCRVRIHASNGESPNGRADAVRSRVAPRSGESPRPDQIARCRSPTSPTRSTRSRVHQPLSVGRGSATTTPVSSVVPPLRASSTSGPVCNRSTCQAVSAATPTKTPAAATAVDTDARGDRWRPLAMAAQPSSATASIAVSGTRSPGSHQPSHPPATAASAHPSSGVGTWLTRPPATTATGRSSPRFPRPHGAGRSRRTSRAACATQRSARPTLARCRAAPRGPSRWRDSG